MKNLIYIFAISAALVSIAVFYGCNNFLATETLNESRSARSKPSPIQSDKLKQQNDTSYISAKADRAFSDKNNK